MKKPVSIATTAEIFEIRNLLQQISHVSFSYAQINKQFPFETIDSEEKAQDLKNTYLRLLRDVRTVINNLNLNHETPQ